MSYMHNDDSDVFLTNKQRAILAVVAAGNGYKDSEFIPCDLDQILDRLTYRTTKESLQFSIRRLIRKGMCVKGKEYEKRRDRYRVLIKPTEVTRDMFRNKLNSYIEVEDEFDLGL